MYRSGHNEADSKSVSRFKPARGFESHRLRQLRIERKILYMNTDMKDKIKFCTAIGILLIIIITVLLIIIQYQVEGEKNMPYQLTKITIISTAEGEQNSDTQEDEQETNSSRWNLNVNQSNDIYFFIDKNSDLTEDILESVTIENIEVKKAPQKGTIKAYMPNSNDGRLFVYDDSFLIDNKLEYKGGKSSNTKTLEIGSKGGFAAIRIANCNIGKFISEEDTEVKHDGTLITKIGETEEEFAFTVSFDIILKINKS